MVVVLATVVGIVAAAAATAFSTLAHEAEHAVWTTIPAWWGATSPPWWWVLAIPALGGVAVWAAIRLPGHGGHHPLDGLAFDATLRNLPSIVLASLAALACGAVIGPEAPLLALGSALGLSMARRAPASAGRLLVLCGAASALGVVLGNPIVVALLLLEAAFLRAPRPGETPPARPLLGLLPVLVALGAGYLVRIGVDDWPGVSIAELSTGPIPDYPIVQGIDLLVGVGVAVATCAALVTALRCAEAVRVVARARPLPLFVAGGLAIGGLALLVRGTTPLGVDVLLFSGQSAMADLTAITVGGTLAVLLLAKAAAYAVSLGVGFRGGTIFPAVFVGMGVGVLGSVVVPGTSLSALAACGIAAGVAVVLGMPATAALLALLLCASAGVTVTVPALVGAILGALTKAAVDARRASVVGPEGEAVGNTPGADGTAGAATPDVG